MMDIIITIYIYIYIFFYSHNIRYYIRTNLYAISKFFIILSNTEYFIIYVIHFWISAKKV